MEYLQMPFVLKNTGQAFQRLMEDVLHGIPSVFVYLDNILVASANPTEHTNHLHQIF